MAGEETPTRKSFQDKNFQPRLRATLVGLPPRAPDGTARTPVLSRNGCGTTCEAAFATAVGRFAPRPSGRAGNGGERRGLHNGRLPLRSLVGLSHAFDQRFHLVRRSHVKDQNVVLGRIDHVGQPSRHLGPSPSR